MQVRSVTDGDVAPAIEALVSAFASDPLLAFLFAGSQDRARDSGTFFRLLLQARVHLRMPAFIANLDGKTLGAVMGYDTSRPDWPPLLTTQWTAWMASVDGLEARLLEYETLADRFRPTAPHYYLGVIGVAADAQGLGVGRQLLEAFGRASAADPASAGVYLETASEASLQFYQNRGYHVRGEGILGRDTRLWCVFQPTGFSTQP